MNVPIIWIIGGPSSGKSTLSQSIAQKYGYKHLDINEMMEHEISRKSAKGSQFAEKLIAGQLVPLADLIPLLEKEIMSSRGGLKGFVIDGYPQNKADAQLLEQSVGAPDLIIALDVTQETLTTRRITQGSRPSITASTYAQNVKPVLEQYASKTMQIDGDRDANVVFEEVVPNMEILNKNRANRITISR